MGCTPLVCCLKDFSANLIALIALVFNVISFGFFIWAIADLLWIRNGPKVLFIISFVLITLCLICIIILFIFINFRKGPNYMIYNNIGKYICLAIILLCILTFILIIIGGIIEICDLKDIKGLPSHDWAALFVPGIFSLIACVVIAWCANALYKIFNENILTTISAHIYNMQNPINQNSVTTIPNTTDNNVVITGNNNGVIPPMIQNSQPNPVVVQQSTPI